MTREAPDHVGADGLLEPAEPPRWAESLEHLEDWLEQPPPRWLARLEERTPSWAVPLLVAAAMGGLAAVVLRWRSQ